MLESSIGKPGAEVRLYQPTDLEIAGGWVNGYEHAAASVGLVLRPRLMLEQVILPYLARGDCHVAFSGGRDSSALLAVAVSLARREGLQSPVPITLVYPSAEGTDELYWQDLVLAHLGVKERIVITAVDEHDALGPVAAPVLRRHGVVWPPNFAPTWRMLDRARNGSLLTGENGDELFGAKRITAITNILKAAKHRRFPDRRLYAHAARAVAPPAFRERRAVREHHHRFWLRPHVAEQLDRLDARDARALSLHAGHHGRQLTFRRGATLCYGELRKLGKEIDSEYVQPFSDPRYVASISNVAGLFGWSGRDEAMARLFGDVLPQEVLLRQSKATFNQAVFTEHSRAFAREWDGSGVDHNLVDPGALRETWLSECPHAMTAGLLQQAWLASQPEAG